MTRQKYGIFLAILLVVIFSTTSHVLAQSSAPETIGSAYFVPSSISSGGSTTLNVDSLKAATGTGTVSLCFYYASAGLDGVFPTAVSGHRATTYTRNYQGVEAGSVNCPKIGAARVTEYSGTPSSVAKLMGESLDFSGPATVANGLYTVDVLELEDTAPTDGFSADLTVTTPPPPPSQVYVSNTLACGGNSPCYAGNSALQQAFMDVADGGTIFIYGTFSQGGGVTATLSGSKSITIAGFNTPVIENGGGTCTGPMIENQGDGKLIISTVALDGTCALGSRSAGILQSGAGITAVKDSFSAIRDFTAAGGAALRVTDGMLIVMGNEFQNNQKALDQAGGVLYAFANNTYTNLGASAATSSAGTYNVTCNYWSASTIAGFEKDYSERLGAPVVNYVEGAGPQTLDAASLADNGGTQVIIGMGRSVNPFGNGTVTGLGARVSDYYAACGTRESASAGTITILGDTVTPGPLGFRLYSIGDPVECSPADNTACWDYQASSCSTVGCSVVDSAGNDGHFMVGNEMDPTNIALQSFSSDGGTGMWVPGVLGLLVLAGLSLAVLRRRAA